MTEVPPGTLIGAGRTADVYALPNGRVLRRYRDRDVSQREVLAMAMAARGGFPVPRVFSVRGPEMILAHVEGPSMQDELLMADEPRIRALALELAGLHEQLHHIQGPADFPTPLGPGASLLHLDLHPRNVLCSPAGPVVIDWANAARGPAAADVAVSAVIFTTAEVAPEYEGARALFTATFLACFEPEEVQRHWSEAARYPPRG